MKKDLNFLGKLIAIAVFSTVCLAASFLLTGCKSQFGVVISTVEAIDAEKAGECWNIFYYEVEHLSSGRHIVAYSNEVFQVGDTIKIY